MSPLGIFKISLISTLFGGWMGFICGVFYIKQRMREALQKANDCVGWIRAAVRIIEGVELPSDEEMLAEARKKKETSVQPKPKE